MIIGKPLQNCKIFFCVVLHILLNRGSGVEMCVQPKYENRLILIIESYAIFVNDEENIVMNTSMSKKVHVSLQRC